jgi:hypothetical protein
METVVEIIRIVAIYAHFVLTIAAVAIAIVFVSIVVPIGLYWVVGKIQQPTSYWTSLHLPLWKR